MYRAAGAGGVLYVGAHVAAVGWLNSASPDQDRSKVLSAKVIAQTRGIIGAQALVPFLIP